MLIATFNCNSVRSRLDIILDWLAERNPDVLALQETKCTDDQFPLAAFRDAGWHVAFRGQKSYNGVALLTREPPDEARFGLGDDEGESEPRVAAVNCKDVHVVNTYVPQGRALDHEQFQFKLAWLGRLRAYFARHFGERGAERRKVVWVGDLNVAPTPADVYDSKKIWPHVCHCQEAIDAFQNVVDWGFVDVFRKHLPAPETFTFWDYRMRDAVERNRGWRIDHILATAPVARTSVECFVDREPRRADKPSDHTFVAARFEL